MNSVTFFAPTGTPVTAAHGSLFPIGQLDPPGNTSGANHVGFFGAGGPKGVPFAIIVDKYQDSTYVTNSTGDNLGLVGVAASGKLNNFKYEASNLATVSGVGSVQLNEIPYYSGTILIRFEASGSTPVRTQNTLCRTVPLNSSSGVDDVTSVVVGVKVQGFEPGQDNTWTQTAGVGALDNRVFLTDHNDSELRHDFWVSLSCSPEATGERNNFGFFFIIEFL